MLAEAQEGDDDVEHRDYQRHEDLVAAREVGHRLLKPAVTDVGVEPDHRGRDPVRIGVPGERTVTKGSIARGLPRNGS